MRGQLHVSFENDNFFIKKGKKKIEFFKLPQRFPTD